MASIRRLRNRQGERYEIRECLATELGPRQHTLVSFAGALTPELLDEAQERARRPFQREKIEARARAMGIPVSPRRRFPEARALLARLQRGEAPDPMLVELLRSALAPLRSEAVPSHLEDAASWIGQSERERGRALRGLLRTADRILRSRGPLRTRPREVFPRFSSERRRP
jgi:transcription initiation factor TFIIIB Brf1 subunit/transcription initiation factor TFIIB